MKKCKEKGCKTRPTYNVEGATNALYCATHKEEGMVNVIHKTCLVPECRKHPSYNVEGTTNALYCADHKEDGMVNVISKTCIVPECRKHPSYNVNGETTPLYCNTHKKEGMVDVKSKTCLVPECKTRPIFNVEGATKALYCNHHKKDGMVDVKNKTCKEKGCKTRPTYNVEGTTTGLYCTTHKEQGMVNVISKTCLKCKKIPIYNVECETTGLYCNDHKEDGMVDVKNKTCKTYLCSKQVREKYDGYCLYCYMNLFPDKPVSRNYKTKEYAVVEHVKTRFPDLDWIADKIVNGGCSRRRPDLLLDLGYQVIMVEVDENQHIDYDCSCENKRMMELSQDVGHRPIVFIRFNPDEYEENGTNNTSCWGNDKKGICVVKKSKKNEWSQRLNVLENHINYWINPENTTNKTIETIQLFYDL